MAKTYKMLKNNDKGEWNNKENKRKLLAIKII